MDLFYKESGKGKPLLLLHGFPLDHSIWDEVITLLDGQYRVIAPDLRGHGRSKASSDKFTIHDMALDVMQLLDDLKAKSAVVAGHSMGGYVALELYRNFQETFNKICLISSHVFEDSAEKKQARMESVDKIKHFGPAGALSNMPDLLTKDSQIKDRCRSMIGKMDGVGAAGAQYAMAHRTSSEKLWKDMPINQLIIAGNADQIIPIDISRKMSNISSHCSLIEVENAGHLPMWEEPVVVADALRKFLD